ncbi:MAG TPA: M48 family metalloprotease [Anaerolineae bacterium]
MQNVTLSDTSPESNPQAEPKLGTRSCPQCGASIPIDPNFTTWCDSCGWNIQPLTPAKPANPFEKLYLTLGIRLGKALKDQLRQTEALRPHLTIERGLAFLLACLTYGLMVMVAGEGIWLIVTGWPRVMIVIFGLFLIAFAVILRPHFAKVPRDIVPRAQAPTLYGLVDRIAQALHAPRLDGIVIDRTYNASYLQAGLMRKRILTVGMPYIAAMKGQELVAIIAHEMAHGVNDDPFRSLVVGGAVNVLFNWYGFLWSTVSSYRREMTIFITLMRIIALIPQAGGYALAHLLWRDCQRAEYLADYLGAQVSGTDAAVAALAKSQLVTVCSLALQHAALNSHRVDGSIFDEMQARVSAVPERELERIHRALKMEQSRLDTTHPPTGFRLDLLELHRCSTAIVTCTESEYQRIYSELQPQQNEIQAQLIDGYLSHLYAAG